MPLVFSATAKPVPPLRSAPSQARSFKLLDFQDNAMPAALSLLKQRKSCQLVAATGLGKTYFIAELSYRLRTECAEHYSEDRAILIITRKSLVIQTSRVLKQRGVRNVYVISINQLRSTIGQLFIEWRTKMVNSEPTIWPYWIKSNLPCLIICDEAQMFKNMESNQAKMMRSWNLGAYGPAFFSSATPYSRPIHTRVIACALGACSDDQFPAWIASVSRPANPLEWSPAAMKRVQAVLEPRTIRFIGAHYKHVTRIHQLLVPLPPEKRKPYNEAMEEYQEARAKQQLNPLTGMAELLVAIMKLRQKAELLRADELSELGHKDATEGKNTILAFNFVETLRVVHSILTEVYEYPADKISIVVGGQSDAERQQNIDAFQLERSHIMLMTFTSGGAGLSLHHTPDNHRPRTLYLPPVWGAEELVQLLGRAHRINSVSTTHQYIVWYAGTIEEKVARKVKIKCSSLKEVVGKQETWVREFDRLAALDSGEPEAPVNLNETKQLNPAPSADDEDSDNPDNLLDIDVESLPVEVGEDVVTVVANNNTTPHDSAML